MYNLIYLASNKLCNLVCILDILTCHSRKNTNVSNNINSDPDACICEGAVINYTKLNAANINNIRWTCLFSQKVFCYK